MGGVPRFGQILVGCVRNRHPRKVKAAARKSSEISVRAGSTTGRASRVFLVSYVRLSVAVLA